MRDTRSGMATFQRHVYLAFGVTVEGNMQLIEQEALHGITTVFGKEAYRDIIVEVMASHEHIVLEGLLILRVFGEHDATLGHGRVAAIKPFRGNEKMHLKALVSKLEGSGATGKAGTNDQDLGTDTQIIHNTPALRQTAAELDLYNYRKSVVSGSFPAYA
jgi:hypothetical protein